MTHAEQIAAMNHAERARLDAAVERFLDAREAQGLPRYVTDPEVGRRIAAILGRVEVTGQDVAA